MRINFISEKVRKTCFSFSFFIWYKIPQSALSAFHFLFTFISLYKNLRYKIMSKIEDIPEIYLKVCHSWNSRKSCSFWSIIHFTLTTFSSSAARMYMIFFSTAFQYEISWNSNLPFLGYFKWYNHLSFIRWTKNHARTWMHDLKSWL